jgi:hypothetical protein
VLPALSSLAVQAVWPVLKKTPVCQPELIAAANSFWRTLLAYNRLYAQAILPSPQDVGVNIVVGEPPPEFAPDRDAVVKHRHLLLHLDKRLTEHAKVKHPHEFMALYKLALGYWIEDLGGGPKGAKRYCRDDPLIDGLRRDAKRLLKRLALFEAVPGFKDIYAPSLWWVSLLQRHRQTNALSKAETAVEIFNYEEAENSLFKIREAISLLVNWLEDASKGVRPRPREIDGYPGLAALVFGLEHAAQVAGGKLTAHRRHGEKGTIIEALDELKRSLAMTDWGGGLADCLPSPGKHPVSKYEHLLRDARKKIASP